MASFSVQEVRGSLRLKILNLLERQIDTGVENKTYKGALRSSRDSLDQNTAFSKGREHKSDPHMFQKYNHTPLAKDSVDGYDVFIRYLISHDIDNPHFPAVYNVKKINDKNTSYITKFDVEKLLKHTQVSVAELIAIMNISFNHDEHTANWLSELEENIDNFKEGEWLNGHKLGDLADSIASRVEFGLHNLDSIRSDSLKQAIKILNTIRNEEKLHVDIHRENVMYRRTAHGLQLVINDPFSFRLK